MRCIVRLNGWMRQKYSMQNFPILRPGMFRPGRQAGSWQAGCLKMPVWLHMLSAAAWPVWPKDLPRMAE